MKKFINLLIVLILSQLHYAQEWDHIDTVDFNWFGAVDNFAVTGPGEIWFGNNEANSPLTYYNDGSVITFDSASYPVLPGNITYNLTVDNTGNIWFTQDTFNWDKDANRIVRFDGTSFTVFDASTTHQEQYFVAGISVDPKNNIYFTDNTRITVFDGTNWETTDYREILGVHRSFGDIEFDDQNNKWINTEFGIYVLKIDNSYELYDTNDGLKSQNISDIEFDSEGNIWIATYWGGVAKANSDFSEVSVWDTTNSQIAIGGDYNTARSVEIDYNGIVWVGHETGVASYDGSTWTYYNSSNSPLPTYDGVTQIVYDIQIDENNNKYFLTLFDGVYIFNEDVINDVDEEGSKPTQFELTQNYPNPFNPSTTINFSIPKQTNVSLKVYDALGKEIAELVNEEMSTGSYKINFDASKFSSGIYFYTLRTNEFFNTRKMILIK